jgi:hypothetical protein
MLYNIKSSLKRIYFTSRYKHSQKIFCIGKNKTGTTSIEKIFKMAGYHVGSQNIGEGLMKFWKKNDFRPIIKFAKYGGEAFQDIPFSWPNTYRVLADNFPESKFILTIRDSGEEWYQSFIHFHSKLFGQGSLPTKYHLINADYNKKGWAWESFRLLHDSPEEDIYNKEILISDYNKHNQEVISFFSGTPERLLVVNLKDKDAAKRITDFLDLPFTLSEIPWENKTSNID